MLGMHLVLVTVTTRVVYNWYEVRQIELVTLNAKCSALT